MIVSDTSRKIAASNRKLMQAWIDGLPFLHRREAEYRLMIVSFVWVGEGCGNSMKNAVWAAVMQFGVPEGTIRRWLRLVRGVSRSDFISLLFFIAPKVTMSEPRMRATNFSEVKRQRDDLAHYREQSRFLASELQKARSETGKMAEALDALDVENKRLRKRLSAVRKAVNGAGEAA